MSAPGVGFVTALTFKAAVDDPTRFKHSRTVAAHFGLTPKALPVRSSLDLDGHISKCDDSGVAIGPLRGRQRDDDPLQSIGHRSKPGE